MSSDRKDQPLEAADIIVPTSDIPQQVLTRRRAVVAQCVLAVIGVGVAVAMFVLLWRMSRDVSTLTEVVVRQIPELSQTVRMAASEARAASRRADRDPALVNRLWAASHGYLILIEVMAAADSTPVTNARVRVVTNHDRGGSSRTLLIRDNWDLHVEGFTDGQGRVYVAAPLPVLEILEILELPSAEPQHSVFVDANGFHSQKRQFASPVTAVLARQLVSSEAIAVRADEVGDRQPDKTERFILQRMR